MAAIQNIFFYDNCMTISGGSPYVLLYLDGNSSYISAFYLLKSGF